MPPVKPVREPDDRNGHVRFDERGRETERWTSRREWPRKTPLAAGAAGPVRHRARPRLYCEVLIHPLEKPSPEAPMAAETKTRWHMSGQGYEFCNCDFGCGCNFGGFPNSKDGSCRALVGFAVANGRCGDVDLSGVKGAGIFVWPKAIHEGNGKAAFIVDPATTDKQGEALAQIFT